MHVRKGCCLLSLHEMGFNGKEDSILMIKRRRDNEHVINQKNKYKLKYIKE